MALSVFANIQRWAGGLLSPAQQSSSPAPNLPDVRTTGRKYTGLLYTGAMAANQLWVSPWFDTNITGATGVTVACFANQNGGNNGFIVFGTNDIGSTAIGGTNETTLGSAPASQANTIASMYVNIPTRYWRFYYLNGSTAATEVNLWYTEFSMPVYMAGISVNGSVSSVTLPTMLISQSGAAGLDGNYIGNMVNSSASPCALQVAPTLQGGGNNAGLGQNQRTPVIYRGGQISAAGQTILWAPQNGKKVRLMKYKLEVAEDATITSGPLPVGVALGFAAAASGGASAITSAFGPNYVHRFVAPSAVLATSGSLYDSGWIDLGNGLLPNSANTALVGALMVPQSTSAINPTWTIATNQWEAATIGFKTLSNNGFYQHIQAVGNSGTAAAVAATLGATTTGSTIIVAFRTTNAAGGTPTVAVTDTAGNSYTTTALTTNASDGTHGSSIGFAYATNTTSNASNNVTLTTSVNVATNVAFMAFEYRNLNGLDAALVGATGSSTSPASGNYTPATAGDLLLTIFATNTNLGNGTFTVANNFRLMASQSSANGTIGIADNFGNGALAAGTVNFIGIGTEE